VGLDATVMCRCFEAGLTTEPPFPREWLHVDSENYLSLRPEHDTQDQWARLYEWAQTCCEHEGMNLASEHISNLAGFELFREALEKLGWEHFPVLARELSNEHGSSTPSDAASLALLELDTFCGQATVGRNAVLVDTKTGYVIFEHIAAYDGVFLLGGRSGVDAGIGAAEFFIRNRETRADLFRATRVKQALLDPVNEGQAYEGRTQFRDLDTGNTYQASVAVSGREIPWPDGRLLNNEGRARTEYPQEFHVEVRDVSPDEFAYIVEPLSKVFRASVATGNPVRWS